ncbi:DNA polymerase III subunit alpha [endosymbiont of Sipalinus gigas]|uniref:DNA polymerase III subunit alpha n=1 Tax=endosymbiont of Sipalinus gigas TaxID=1972134 RepID=UPI000DC6F3B2|nr:DNA polymerase III subunit alpha [endosymbiont of Sipalinus gigas]BBA85299.1 DNA polymerase III subunit alpha [endosymbiont of Sipalinus gigas]
MKFVHLRIHSEFSIIDGLSKLDILIKKAKEFNMDSLAITDFTNLFGMINFYELCCKNNIKPIIGSDFNLYTNSDEISEITLLVKNLYGYKNLISLINSAYNYNININEKLLFKHNKGLIILIGFNSYIGKYLLNNKYNNLLEEKILLYNKYFYDNFYIEINRIGINNESFYINKCIEISYKYNIPIVATNNVRFIDKEDFKYHKIKVSIYNNSSYTKIKNYRLYTCEQYFKNIDSMIKLFDDIPESIINSIEISKRCNLILNLKKKVYLPKFNIKNDKISSYDLLNKLSKLGLIKILNNLKIKDKKEKIIKYKLYFNRLNKELNVINIMNFSDYFLIVMELIKWAKDNNIPVGPGRGSGAGSLVAYSLDITNLDPIKFNLLFERFLNCERASIPDLDIDFCMEKRDKVINYVFSKYKDNFVSKIITFSKMTARSIIKDVGKVLGYTYNFTNKITQYIPNILGITLNKTLKLKTELYNLYINDVNIKNLIDISIKLEGTVKNVGKHSGGIIISPNIIKNIIPIYKNINEEILVTQFNKSDIEKIGLIKFDFLGLKTLTIIKSTIDIINNNLSNKKKIDISKISLNDNKSFNMLRSCNTNGIFQLESYGIKKLIKKIRPDKFEELMDIIALFRPGPLKSGMVDKYINRKNNKEKIFYPDKSCSHNLLINILHSTYGIILYQEQIMEISRIFSNYSPIESDILRIIISKKKINDIKDHYKKFVDGALEKNNIKLDLSSNLFKIIEKFSGYCFNKSHSAAYALITYRTLWLKSNFTEEFMSSYINYHLDDKNKINSIINECKLLNINIIYLNINLSNYYFYVNDKKEIIYGLSIIKGIPKSNIINILKIRNNFGYFKNLKDFLYKIIVKSDIKINKKTIESIIESGACNIFELNKVNMIKYLNYYFSIFYKKNNIKNNNQIDMFN